LSGRHFNAVLVCGVNGHRLVGVGLVLPAMLSMPLMFRAKNIRLLRQWVLLLRREPWGFLNSRLHHVAHHGGSTVSLLVLIYGGASFRGY